MPADQTLEAITGAWAAMTRRANLPALRERMRRESGVELQPTGYVMLQRLDEQGALLISELAEAAGVDVSTTSRVLRQLGAAGYVERQRGVEDARCVQIHITAAGREALVAVRGAWQRMLAQVLARWAPADREAFAVFFTRFADDFIASSRDRHEAIAAGR